MSKPIHVLLVEDNPGDSDLIRETLEAGKIAVEMTVAVDGPAALELLLHACSNPDAELPDLIMLDLNLPKMDGREVLAKIKTNAELRAIPIVIMTSSNAERDVAESYRLGANCYVTKPIELAAFQTIVASIEHFWFRIVKLPEARS